MSAAAQVTHEETISRLSSTLEAARLSSDAEVSRLSAESAATCSELHALQAVLSVERIEARQTKETCQSLQVKAAELQQASDESCARRQSRPSAGSQTASSETARTLTAAATTQTDGLPAEEPPAECRDSDTMERLQSSLSAVEARLSDVALERDTAVKKLLEVHDQLASQRQEYDRQSQV
jgi:hypothetical protein